MTDEAEQVSITSLVDTKQPPGVAKRRQWSEALKRRIVAETLEVPPFVPNPEPPPQPFLPLNLVGRFESELHQ